MLIDDPTRKGANRNVNLNQSDDDDYGDNGSGIEDDAPEGFQALQRPEQPIITFPDLLRVPTTTANMDPEDDSPESLSFASAAGQPVRPSDLPMPPTPRPISSTTGDPIGGLPRNRRPLSHPDVSQINLSPTASTNPPVAPSSSVSSFEQPTARPLPPLPPRDQPQSSGVSNQPTSSNLPSSLDSPSSISPPSPQSLAPILNAITRIQSSVEILSRQFNERLDGMENRINEISSNSPVGNPANFNPLTPDLIRNFMQEQRREMQNQRRSFVLSFAEALRFAADRPNQNGSPKSPKSPKSPSSNNNPPQP